MHPVVALLKHNRTGPVDHVGRHFNTAIRRQAVHEDRVGSGGSHHRVIDREAFKLLKLLGLVGFFAHRDPGVGMDGVRSDDHVDRAAPLLDRCGPEEKNPFELGVVGFEAGRRRKTHVHPKKRRNLGE